MSKTGKGPADNDRNTRVTVRKKGPDTRVVKPKTSENGGEWVVWSDEERPPVLRPDPASSSLEAKKTGEEGGYQTPERKKCDRPEVSKTGRGVE